MLSLALFCAAYYLAAALGAVLGYHRCLAHRAFALPKWLERAFVLLALPAGPPVAWVANHRLHHAHADTPDDPHSPHHGGFWHAHCGWYLGRAHPALCLAYALAGPLRLLVDARIRPLRERAPRGEPGPRGERPARMAPDAAADRWYAALGRPGPFAAAMAVHAVVPFGFAAWAWGWAGFLALWATLAFAYNCGDAVNSVGHLAGRRAGGSASLAGNVPALALLAFGDGWHANHHRHPGSARAGIGPRQFDPAWLALRLLAAAGLARDIAIRPEPRRRAGPEKPRPRI